MSEKWKDNHFVVEIEGIASPGINEVEGISFGEQGTIEQIDAGTNRVDKIASHIVKWPPLVLIREADGSSDDQAWLDWFVEQFDYNNIGASIGSNSRKNGAIIKKEYGVEVARYAFVGAWIKSITPSNLAAANEGILKYTITLEHAGMYPEIL